MIDMTYDPAADAVYMYVGSGLIDHAKEAYPSSTVWLRTALPRDGNPFGEQSPRTLAWHRPPARQSNVPQFASAVIAGKMPH